MSVCRYCGEPWKGFEVEAARQPDPGNHDPGIFAARTNCCRRWVGGDASTDYAYKKGEYAAVDEMTYAYLRHYELT